MFRPKFRRFAAAALAIAFAAAGSAGSAPKPAARPAGGVKLYVIDCGVLLYNSFARFGYKNGEVSGHTLSDGCFLIDDPGKGTMIWDTGVVPDKMWRPGGLPPKKEYGEGIKSVTAQLAEIGIKPEEVTYAAVSHLHWDHVANLYLFSHSTWLVHPWTREKVNEKGDKYDPSMFEDLKSTKTIALPTDKDYDVFGDGRVTIIQTPGHTPDSAVLLVKLARSGPVLLTGDLYHLRKDLASHNTMPTDDRGQVLEQRRKIEALAKKTGAQIWIAHDPGDFAKLKKAPAFYD